MILEKDEALSSSNQIKRREATSTGYSFPLTWNPEVTGALTLNLCLIRSLNQNTLQEYNYKMYLTRSTSRVKESYEKTLQTFNLDK